jgi:2-iminobutanoate/2-iminopropanoate deaminase
MRVKRARVLVVAAAIGIVLCPVVARATEAKMEFYSAPEARAAKLPFSQAVRVGDVLYLSGALGNLPGKMELVPGGIEGETRQTMANIASVLHAHNLTFDDVFKCTAMLADMKEWAAFNKVYLTYFKPDRLPARSAFGAAALALGARVELECWAYVGHK